MSMDLKRQEFSTAPQYFEAGVTIPIKTAVKTASEALDAHAPVLLDSQSGKVKKVSSAEELTGLYGITLESAESEKEVVVALTGEFFADALKLEAEVTAAKLEVPFRNIGIFLVDVPAEDP